MCFEWILSSWRDTREAERKWLFQRMRKRKYHFGDSAAHALVEYDAKRTRHFAEFDQMTLLQEVHSLRLSQWSPREMSLVP